MSPDQLVDVVRGHSPFVDHVDYEQLSRILMEHQLAFDDAKGRGSIDEQWAQFVSSVVDVEAVQVIALQRAARSLGMSEAPPETIIGALPTLMKFATMFVEGVVVGGQLERERPTGNG